MKAATGHRMPWIRMCQVVGCRNLFAAVLLIFPALLDSASGDEGKQDFRDLAEDELGTSPSVFVRILWEQGVNGEEASDALDMKSKMEDVRDIFADIRFLRRTNRTQAFSLIKIAEDLDKKYLSRLCRESVIDLLSDHRTAEQSCLYLRYLEESNPDLIPFDRVIEAFVAGRLSGLELDGSDSRIVYFLRALKRSVEELGLPEAGFDVLSAYEEIAAREKEPFFDVLGPLLHVRDSANEVNSDNIGE